MRSHQIVGESKISDPIHASASCVVTTHSPLRLTIFMDQNVMPYNMIISNIFNPVTKGGLKTLTYMYCVDI